jgi:N-acetylneuraminic acid mutarotase
MNRYPLFSFVIFLFPFSSSYSQNGPEPRASAHLFYFKPKQSLILLDGYDAGIKPGSGKAELWEWKNDQWKKIDSSDQPLRSLSGAVYLNDKDQVFIYGGIGTSGYDDSLKESYSFDGKQWKRIADQSIGTHDHHEMAYDVSNQMIVVYGGQTGTREFDTRTWIYKDNKWKILNIPAPGPRVHHAMAYDVTRKKIVLYGGYSDKADTDETWEFDGIEWKKVLTQINPGARGHHAMLYDPVSKKVLLYGGKTEMSIKGDVWVWDGITWKMISDNGPQRILPALGFNPDNNKLYVFGGNGGENFATIYSDLWEWDGKIWRTLSKGKTYKYDMDKNMYIRIQD